MREREVEIGTAEWAQQGRVLLERYQAALPHLREYAENAVWVHEQAEEMVRALECVLPAEPTR